MWGMPHNGPASMRGFGLRVGLCAAMLARYCCGSFFFNIYRILFANRQLTDHALKAVF